MQRLFATSVVVTLLYSCSTPDPQSLDATNAIVSPEAGDIDEGGIFIDVATDVGLNFTHDSGMTGELIYSEMMGSGAALFDFDQDGDLDAYLVQGGNHENAADRLFRNEMSPSGTLAFSDITSTAGFVDDGYGMGVTVFDVDNNGHSDLFVTNLGPNLLLRNLGGTSFEDATPEALTKDHRWSVSAAPLDFDRDGWTDLFVCNYLEFHPTANKRCFDEVGSPTYCGPLAYPPLTDSLLRNLGDGTFEDVSAQTGISEHFGGCLGVSTGDFDDDGWTDIYVANDGMPNQLWRNRDGKAFENLALMSGASVSGLGSPEASMGVAVGDYDSDGDEDILVTHLRRETNTLYENDGTGRFDDRSSIAGLGLPSWSLTGFGVGWLDYDNDTRLDLLVVNGAVKVLHDQQQAGDPHPLKQANQLYRQIDGLDFVELSAGLGDLGQIDVSRGASFGDVDNDGDTDVLVTNNNGPSQLLLNTVGQDRAWIGLRLMEAPLPSSRPIDSLGARVALIIDAKPSQWRTVRIDGSYASAHDSRVLLGLTEPGGGQEILVVWPDGSREQWSDLESGAYHQLLRGQGRSVERRAR